MTLKDWKLKEVLQGVGLISALVGLPVLADEDLAYGKTAWASSELQPAKLAFDGDSNSRWESTHKVAVCRNEKQVVSIGVQHLYGVWAAWPQCRVVVRM